MLLHEWSQKSKHWQRDVHCLLKEISVTKTKPCVKYRTLQCHDTVLAGQGAKGWAHTPGSWELRSTGSPWPTAWSRKQPHRPAGPGRARGAGAGKPRCCWWYVSAATHTRVTPAHPIAASCWTHAREAQQNLGKPDWLARGIDPALPSCATADVEITASRHGEFLSIQVLISCKGKVELKI